LEGLRAESLIEVENALVVGARISAMATVDIRRSTLASPDAVRLIAALNAELEATFPEPGATHFSLTSAQVESGDGAFIVAYLDGAAVGCGAVRRLDEATAELKRMYVDPSARGRGHRPRARRCPRG
jgi:GNAT superfamily N-acetyltransferase